MGRATIVGDLIDNEHYTDGSIEVLEHQGTGVRLI